mmetsp:Transcript_10791/g.25514  ORF Transcript_10791/g.25514 Transcript_10791/m.25514 type:complete len:203 (-) Transcript_10791:197-805(-)
MLMEEGAQCPGARCERRVPGGQGCIREAGAVVAKEGRARIESVATNPQVEDAHNLEVAVRAELLLIILGVVKPPVPCLCQKLLVPYAVLLLGAWVAALCRLRGLWQEVLDWRAQDASPNHEITNQGGDTARQVDHSSSRIVIVAMACSTAAEVAAEDAVTMTPDTLGQDRIRETGHDYCIAKIGHQMCPFGHGPRADGYARG